MKRIALAFVAFMLLSNVFAQKNKYVKQPSIGLHFVLNDFNTATALRTSSLGEVMRSNVWNQIGDMDPGVGVSYIKGLSDHLDFAGNISASYRDGGALIEGVATGNLKLTSDKFWVSPFLTLGVGASQFKGSYGALIPAGVGLQVNFWDDVFLLINSQYRMPVTEGIKYHMYHSLGLAGTLFDKKQPVIEKLPEIVPEVVEVPKDTDGDGIIDINDKCPAVKGLEKYYGCPIPDTDGDGINDEQDKCKDVKGLARYNGCPIPDTDGDGVNDEEDKCPKEAGVISNYGCPEISKAIIEKINIAAKNIFFSTGSAKLLPKSFKSLDEVVTILNDNPSYTLDVNGYTDSTGTVEKNLILSKNRAASVVEYIISKGIDADRLHPEGFGVDNPVADNKTVKGRALNRRVEIIAKNY